MPTKTPGQNFKTSLVCVISISDWGSSYTELQFKRPFLVAEQACKLGAYPGACNYVDPTTSVSVSKTVRVTLTALKFEVLLSANKNSVEPGEMLAYSINIANKDTEASLNGKVSFAICDGFEVVDLAGGNLSSDKKLSSIVFVQ